MVLYVQLIIMLVMMILKDKKFGGAQDQQFFPMGPTEGDRVTGSRSHGVSVAKQETEHESSRFSVAAHRSSAVR